MKHILFSIIFFSSLTFLLNASAQTTAGCAQDSIYRFVDGVKVDYTNNERENGVRMSCDRRSDTLTANVFAWGNPNSGYVCESIAYDNSLNYVLSNEINLPYDDIWGPAFHLDSGYVVPNGVPTFSFNFFGNNYSEVIPNSNGSLKFPRDATDSNDCSRNSSCSYMNSSTLPDTRIGWSGSNSSSYHNSPVLNAIMTPFHDIHFNSSRSNYPGHMYFEIEGEYPCRKVLLSYYQVPDYVSTGGPYYSYNSDANMNDNNIATHMAVLYETTNIVELYIKHTGPITSTNNGNRVLGIQNYDGQFVCPPNRNNGNWTADYEAWRIRPTGALDFDMHWFKRTSEGDSAGVLQGPLQELDSVNHTIIATPTTRDGATTYITRAKIWRLDGNFFYVYDSITYYPSEDLGDMELSTPRQTLYTQNNDERNPQLRDTVCYGDSIRLTLRGANIYSIVEPTPSAYSITTQTLPDGSVEGTLTMPYPEGEDSVKFVFEYLSIIDENGTQVECSRKLACMIVSIQTDLDLGEDHSICQGETITLQNNSNNNIQGNYLWSDGSTQSSLTITPQSSNYIRCTFTDIYGCVNRDSVWVEVNENPVITIGGDLDICNGESTTLTANSSLNNCSFTWNTGETSPTITVTPEASTTYTVTIEENNTHCQGSVEATVTVNPNPQVTIGGDLDLCNGESTTLTANSSLNNCSFTWNIGETSPTITVSPDATTTYSVTVQENNTLCQGSAETTVTVNPLPVVTISGDLAVCEGSSTTLTANSSLNNCSFTWNNGETSLTIAVTPEASTTYNVTVQDIITGCQGSAEATVTVNPNPQITIGGDLDLCNGESTTLTANISSNNFNYNYTYTWNDGETSPTITVTPEATTTYSVTVQENNTLCQGSAETTVTVNPNPQVTIGGDLDLCNGESTTLTANSSLNNCSFTWNTGETSPTITVTPEASTTYNVTVQDIITGCQGSAETTVTVNPNPQVTIGGDSDLCNGESTTLTASSSLNNCSFTWNTGESNPSITATPDATTTYSVTVQENNTLCQGSVEATVTVNPNPQVTIDGTLDICNGQSTTLTASSSLDNCSFTWNTGETSPTITVTPEASTTYNVTVQENNTLCQGSANTSVNVYNPPEVTITGDFEICEGESTTLTAQSSLPDCIYLWNTGETTPTITVSSNTSTTYSVTVSVKYSPALCETVANATVTVHPNPQITIGGDLDICNGESTTLTASSSLNNCSFTWNTGETSPTITVTPEASTTYNVTVQDIITGCQGSAETTVIVNPNPQVTIGGDLDLCNGESTTLTASSSLDNCSFTWSNNETSPTIAVTPEASTTYSVTVQENNTLCQGSTEATVIVNPNPQVTIGGDQAVCTGGSTTLTANPSSDSYTYSWNNGETSPTITVTPDATTTYSVTVQENNTLCQGSAETTVTVNPNPQVTIDGTLDICNGQSTTLTASSSLDNCFFTWNTGETSPTITVTPEASTTYNVTVQDNNTLCQGSANTSVNVYNPPEVTITGNFEICEGESTTLTAQSSLPDCLYLWNTGETTPTITVSSNTSTTYSVTVSVKYSPALCETVANATVTVHPNPQITIGGDLDICNGESTTLTASSSLNNCSFTWNTGETSPTITVSPDATTTYSVTVQENNTLCQGSAETTVIVNPNPQVTIGGVLDICNGESTTLTASSSLNNCSYIWSNNETNPSITINPTETSTYNVTVQEITTLCQGSANVSVNVYNPPEVTITGDLEICEGESTTLTAQSSLPNCVYLWNTGETTPTITISPESSSEYSVSVKFSPAMCETVASATITVNPNPLVTIDGTLDICNGESTTLTASSSLDNCSFTWSNNETTQTIEVSPNTSTRYSVEVQEASTLCKGGAGVSVTVYNPPEVTITGNFEICEGESTTLTAQSSLPDCLYLWNTGETTPTITVSSNTSTTYSVTVSVKYSPALCETVANATVTVHPNPQITIGGDLDICNGESTTLTASSSLDNCSFTWSTGETSPTITVTPEASTTYSVTVQENSTLCQGSANTTVTVNPNPQVTIGGVLDICNGESTTLTASSSLNNCSYTWSNNETNPSITINPTETSTYSVTVQEITTFCQGSANVSVNVYNPPEVTITGDLEICEGESTTLTAQSSLPNCVYLWNTTETIPTITISPESSSEYSVSVKFSPAMCETVASATITVNPNPLVTIDGTLDICNGESTTLTASSSLDNCSFTWSNNETTQTIEVSPNTSTRYSVEVQEMNTMCRSGAGVSVTVYNPPEVTIEGRKEICEGESTTLTAQSSLPDCLYLWNTGETTPTITISPESTTDYSVSVKYSPAMCETIANTTITVRKAPAISCSEDKKICAGESTQISVSTTEDYTPLYVWHSSDDRVDGKTDDSYTVAPRATTVYNVSAFNNINCRSDAAVTVYVEQFPIPAIIAEPTIIEPTFPTLHLTDASTGNTSTLWEISDGATSQERDFVHNLNIDDTSMSYNVILTVSTDFGCSVTTEQKIWINRKHHCWAPTGVHIGDPDPQNATFRLYMDNVVEFDLKIYNRWGTLIFETNDINQAWDCTYKGTKVPNGVYVWRALTRHYNQNQPLYEDAGEFMVFE